MREAVINHLVHIEDFTIGHHISLEYSSVMEYIMGTDMDKDGAWASDIEMLTASHMLNTMLYMYDTAVLGVHMDPITLIYQWVQM